MEVYRLPNWVETESDLELYHHGVKGQRWGVRRYQNEDGTLTALGRKRLEGYQKREFGLVQKRIDSGTRDLERHKAKLLKKAEAFKASGRNDKAEHYKNEAKSGEVTKQFEAKISLAKKEMSVIKNYKLSDFQKEAHDVRVENGKAATAGVIANLAANAVLIPTTHRAMIVYRIPNDAASKASRRIEMATRGEKGYVSDKVRKYESKSKSAKNADKKKKFEAKYREQLEKERRKYG